MKSSPFPMWKVRHMVEIEKPAFKMSAKDCMYIFKAILQPNWKYIHSSKSYL